MVISIFIAQANMDKDKYYKINTLVYVNSTLLSNGDIYFFLIQASIEKIYLEMISIIK